MKCLCERFWDEIKQFLLILLNYSDDLAEINTIAKLSGTQKTSDWTYQLHALYMVLVAIFVFFAGVAVSISVQSIIGLSTAGAIIGCLGLFSYTMNSPEKRALSFLSEYTDAMERKHGPDPTKYGKYHRPYFNAQCAAIRTLSKYTWAKLVITVDIFTTLGGTLVNFYPDETLLFITARTY